jgi:hypothetical protein
MIVIVDERLFQGDCATDVERLALLSSAAFRSHGLVCQAAPRRAVASDAPCPIEQWRSTLNSRLQREARHLLDAIRCSMDSTAYGADRLLVSSRWDSRGECVVPLDVALKLLAEPLHILVEDGLRGLPPIWWTPRHECKGGPS